jgi:hypothetical protein
LDGNMSVSRHSEIKESSFCSDVCSLHRGPMVCWDTSPGEDCFQAGHILQQGSSCRTPFSAIGPVFNTPQTSDHQGLNFSGSGMLKFWQRG